MTFEIKIKAGFFKTQPYYLTIETRQIILTPQSEAENGRVVIDDKDLKAVSIISKNMNSSEIEIITYSNTYIGSINSENDLKEITRHLAQEFGGKFILQCGNV